MKSIYEYGTYKAYLEDWTADKGRGEKSRIAQALRCNVAYVSQVLSGPAHFSLEQADALNAYLSHSEDEGEFFLLLVSHARAGTVSLRKRCEDRIRRTLQERLVLENRLKLKRSLPADHQAIYYGTWYYSAIHVMLGIPAFQTKEAIARHLSLPLVRVTEAVEFLTECGLAQYAEGRYSTGQVTLHLSNDSPWTGRQHAAWRLRSIQTLDRKDSDDFRYTSVISMAKQDVPTVRKIMVEAIEQIRRVVKDSPEDNVYCYALDLFGA